MAQVEQQVRGAEDAEHAFCIAAEGDRGSCCAPATHRLYGDDSRGEPYFTYYCERHPCSGAYGPAHRYRSNADALEALPAVTRHIEAQMHANDVEGAMARCRKGAERLAELVEEHRRVMGTAG